MKDRLFIAIDPPENISQGLAAICRGIRGARWTTEKQLHLTLRFIGEVDRQTMLRIDDTLRGLRFSPFNLALAGTGFFPPRRPPRIIWVGIEECEELLDLRKRMDSRLLRQAGIGPEEHRYHPHITLARLKRPENSQVRDFLALHAGLRSPGFRVREFHLYSSRLTPKGAIHTLEASYPG